MMMNNPTEVRCCPECNYLTTVAEIEGFCGDYVCPNCGEAYGSDFYSVGSTTHQQIVAGERYQCKRKRVSPLPLDLNETLFS